MNSGLSPADPTLVAAFRSALLHQGGIALLIVAFCWLVWATVRTWQLTTPTAKVAGTGEATGTDEDVKAAGITGETRAGGTTAAKAGTGGLAKLGTGGLRRMRRSVPEARVGSVPEARVGSVPEARVGSVPEARGRWLLRVGFGVIWIVDGILQAQPKMAGGLASQVIEPTAAASPTWVQHVVNWGGTAWSYHPIQAAAASVWIQVGIGGWLLVAARGRWSRLVGLASVAWGLAVWVFGESFGGIFAPGLSWLTGAPGAVLLYVVAGALIALPEGAWRSPRLGRLLLGGLGIFFVGMAVLQAWPGRGSWQGTLHGQPGPLTAMVQSMASTPQPHFLSALLSAFGSFAASNALAVNLVMVIALAAVGTIFLTGSPRLVRWAMWFCVVFFLAVWVLVQDLGFLGGLGTDPNSMIPFLLLIAAGYLGLTQLPQKAAEVEEASGAGETEGVDGASQRWRGLAPRAVGRTVAAASAQSVGAVAALAVVVLGAAPMATAAVNRTADPILALAIAGGSTQMDTPADGFALTDQNGQTVTLASLRGKVVLMTFLDPVCTSDCPLIGEEFKEAGILLGSQDKDVDLVAIVANPTYRSVAFTRAFDREDGLESVPNWLYLTGSLGALAQVWRDYGVSVANLPAGAMSAHNDLAVVIDRSGKIREEVGADPGPGTSSTQSSFSVLLSQYARQALNS
ncbi:MAG: SCO family protein [Streptosporangiaceae bacterium]